MPVAAPPRRKAILEAALQTFLEDGVSAASIENICARAQASVGSLYHHFDDKQSLAGAVYIMALGDYQAAFLAVLDRHPDDAGHAVRTVVATHLRWCLRDRPDFARFLIFHGDAARGAALEELDGLNRNFFANVRRWWLPHARYGALRDVDLDLAYALWLGPAQEYCRLCLAGRTALAPGRAGGALADAAWKSLRSTEGDL